MGRPAIEITPELCEKAESLAAQGLTMEQIALVLGMGVSTLYEKKAEYTEFLEAIKDGQAKGVAIVTNALFVSAKGGNLGAQCFYLKNRAGWKDRQEIEHSGDIGNNGGVCRATEILQGFIESRQDNVDAGTVQG